ncbi:chorion class B protein L11-like [Hordeum vulgare subsp. vulgare]|uniref:chorion class B protein L11-like n=1 Tax=Hordeum vulgare subsp. vulgare TaxID=112509 RepID=UPI001D1A3428|nr:chorion class B protein L11-like [Hordeum vulgare subsp. vulgare]
MASNPMSYPRCWALVAIVMAASWTCSSPASSVDAMVPPMTMAAASGGNVPVPAASGVPLGSLAAAPAATPATPAKGATASKKIPLPVPETLPGAEGLGFGGGYGGQTVPGGGLGGFNGDEGGFGGFGGCCGGFGYNGGLGYNNGPFFFNSAPASGNGLAPLLVACAAALFYV